MRFLWTYPDESRSSKAIYDAVIEVLPDGKTISRSSIIVSVNALVDDGVLGFHEVWGRGGIRRIYKSKLDESGYKQYIVETMLGALLDEFPEETRKVLQELI